MAGDEPRILNEWRRLVGDPAYEAPDFSDNWPVKFGQYIEPLALDWHQRKLGYLLTCRGDSVVHPTRAYVSCTLDAFDAERSMVIDVKATWKSIDEIADYYRPQLVVQRACMAAERAALLVVLYGREPVEMELTIPPDYEAEVWRRIDQFWACVENLALPITLPPVAAPITEFREYDMGTSNSWAAHAGVWTETREAAKRFESSATELKALMPADARRAYGHGIAAERNRADSITIKEVRT
jgi:hypothetical protein